jgi:hypothetical protein
MVQFLTFLANIAPALARQVFLALGRSHAAKGREKKVRKKGVKKRCEKRQEKVGKKSGASFFHFQIRPGERDQFFALVSSRPLPLPTFLI